MKRLARSVAVAAVTLGMAGFAAPAASAADINFNNLDGDGVIANERGPGDLSAQYVEDSKNVKIPSQNESIKADIKNKLKGKHNHNRVEVEGSEQDQGRGA